jgi:hypothetical protein
MYRLSVLLAAFAASMVTITRTSVLSAQMSLLETLSTDFPKTKHKKSAIFSRKSGRVAQRSFVRARAPRSTIALLRKEARDAVRSPKQGRRNGSR